MLGYRKDMFGIPLEIGYRFRLNGKRYQITQEGVATLQLLLSLHARARNASDHNWAIRARALIEKIEYYGDTPTLTLVATRARHSTIRDLAIWLRGRCGGRIGSRAIAEFASDPNFSTRKEVVRALKRMADWPTIRSMAENDPSPRIRRLATCQPARPIKQRVEDFSKHVQPQRTRPPSKMRLFVWPDADLTEQTPPRSASFFRVILQRIARLVGRQV